MKLLARREIKLLPSFGGRIIFLDNLLLWFKLIFETEAWWKADQKQVNTQKKQQNETLPRFHGQPLLLRNTDREIEMLPRALSFHRNYSPDLNPFTVFVFWKPCLEGWTYSRTSPGADVAEALWVSPASPSWTNTSHRTPPNFAWGVATCIILVESGGAAGIREVMWIITPCSANYTRLPGAWVQGV